MKKTEEYGLNMPEDNDLINVNLISSNFEKIDYAMSVVPIKQNFAKTDIDVTAYPPYWIMHNSGDENIKYIDHNFFDEEFTIEAGQTIKTEINEPTNINISSETTIDYTYFIPAEKAFSGGGKGGTSDYNELDNQPKINNVILSGNKTSEDLGLVGADEKGVASGIATLDEEGKVTSSQLPDMPDQNEYKITEIESESYAKTYKLQIKKNGSWADLLESSLINIPKDMVVESGSVKECTTDNVPVSGYKKGDKYIDLVIANKADAHIYINVKDLVDDKASGISYSNTTSKLTATTVQAALDEIASLAKGNESDISDINEALEKKVNQTELSSAIDGVKTNILSTIVASSNASASNSKTIEFQGTGKNLEKLVVEGKTVQDGTPSPSAPVEVKGVGDGGWNIMPFAKKETKKVGNITVDSDGLGTYHIYGSNSSGTQNITFDIDSFVIPTAVGKSGKGCLYYNNTAANGLNSIYFLNSGASVDYYSMSPVNRVISTYDDLGGKTVNQIRFAIGATGTIDFKVSLMVTNDGKTDHEFVPGGKYKIPISCGGKSSNIYLDAPLYNGDKLDSEDGTVDKKSEIIVLNGSSSEQWAFDSSFTGTKTKHFYYDTRKTHSTSVCYSNRLAYLGGNEDAEHLRLGSTNNTHLNIWVPSSITSVEQLKTWLNNNPLIVVCSLTTPTKETFDAPEISTTVGKNTLALSTDVTPAKVEVTSFGEYYSKSQIDKMFAETISYGNIISTGSVWNGGWLDSSSYINVYYKPYTKQVIIDMHLKPSKTWNASTIGTEAKSLFFLPSDVPIPTAAIRCDVITSGYTVLLQKNNVNSVGAFLLLSGELDNTKDIYGRLEYTVI